MLSEAFWFTDVPVLDPHISPSVTTFTIAIHPDLISYGYVDYRKQNVDV
jgi:hypothetical protein